MPNNANFYTLLETKLRAAGEDVVVEGWLAELTTNPWSGAPPVIRLGGRGAVPQASLDDFLGGLDLTERGVAVLDEAPTRVQAEEIRALYATGNWLDIDSVDDVVAGANF